jgi:putative FmdB family regulatory protein
MSSLDQTTHKESRMPTYLFGCTDEKCQHKFEEMLSITTKIDDCPVCPKCGGKTVRLINFGGGLRVDPGADGIQAEIDKLSAQMVKDAYRDEKIMANLTVGDSKYNADKNAYTKAMRNHGIKVKQ